MCFWSQIPTESRIRSRLSEDTESALFMIKNMCFGHVIEIIKPKFTKLNDCLLLHTHLAILGRTKQRVS